MPRFTNKREPFNLIKDRCGTCAFFNTFMSKPNMDTGYCHQVMRENMTCGNIDKMEKHDMFFTVDREWGCRSWREPFKVSKKFISENPEEWELLKDQYCFHLIVKEKCWECFPQGYTLPDSEYYNEGEEVFGP